MYQTTRLTNVFSIVFTLSAAIGFAGNTATESADEHAVAFAARPVESAEDKAPPIFKRYKGIVVRAAKDRLTVRLKWKGNKTFQVDPNATITRNGNAVRLRKLRRNDQVRLTSESDESGERLTIVRAWMPL
jgi:hypothetical protein